MTAAFIQRFEGPVNDLIAPIDHTLADTQIGVAYGITTLPHLKDLSIVGPQQRHRHLRHGEPPEDLHVPADVGRRRDGVRHEDRRGAGGAGVPPSGGRARIQRLMRFYDEGREERDFEFGIASALEAMLASPQFVFRLERAPAAAAATAAGPRPVSASAIWSSRRACRSSCGAAAPDAELLKVAAPGG